MGKDMVEKQKLEWLDDADIRLRTIMSDAEVRFHTIANESTEKLRFTILTAACIVAAGLVLLAAAIAFN